MTADLAARLVACPEWAWMPGMLARGGGYLPAALTGRHWGRTTERLLAPASPHLDHAIPDLSDPATVGCLLAMLPPGWTLGTAYGVTVIPSPGAGAAIRGATLGEAVARALLAVWGGR